MASSTPQGLLLALGIISTPADRTTRDNIRRTWLRDRAFRDGRAAGRFVFGSSTCAHTAADDEQRVHGDVAFVNASDCAPWHAGHKVHAWYQHALRHFTAQFYAKAEDDSLVSVGRLLRDLSMLSRAQPSVHLYGLNLQWIAHCRQRLAGERWSKSLSAKSCAQGCWLGRLGGSGKSIQRPPRCERGFDGAAVTAGSDACPMLPYAPFAPGPLEVRSARLASVVAGCRYADQYFASLVARGALIADECASTDGSQGHAIGECAAETMGALIVADGDARRQAYASSGTFAMLQRANASGAAAIAAARTGTNRRGVSSALELTTILPIKPDRTADTWTSLWSLLEPLAPVASTSHSQESTGASTLAIARVAWDGKHKPGVRRRPSVTTLAP